ncbi:MAG: hypothetical protein C4297_02995 [Gemmataceae bacterium]
MCALAVLLAVTFTENLPQWEVRYGVALDKARASGDALLIVFSKGSAGWRDAFPQDQPFGHDLELLGRRYILLYVDVATDYGAGIAKAFEVDHRPFVVVTDRGAHYQLVRRPGRLPRSLVVEWAQGSTSDNVDRSSDVAPAVYSEKSTSPVIRRSILRSCPT